MAKKSKQLSVKGAEIRIYAGDQQDYISLTDIARYKKSDHTDDLIRNWIRNRNTIEFIGIWEQLNNPDFKPVEFDWFKKEGGGSMMGEGKVRNEIYKMWNINEK